MEHELDGVTDSERDGSGGRVPTEEAHLGPESHSRDYESKRMRNIRRTRAELECKESFIEKWPTIVVGGWCPCIVVCICL